MRTRLDKQQGISILELVLVISILFILASIALPAYSFFKRKAQDAACMSNLRSLHASFSSYLGDHGFVWPQSPYVEKDADDPSTEAKWWFERLEAYGGTREVWLCPSERSGFVVDEDEDNFEMTYVPTHFDETPNIAYKWSRQPWLIERGGFHDQGSANKVMPDGSIQKDSAPDVLSKK